MTDFSFVLLYVENPLASAAFYEKLLGRPAVESAPTFAMVPLREGCMLGLWAKGGVEPKPEGGAGSSEIAFTVADAGEVEATHAVWLEQGLRIAQPPVKLDFGTTFTALDLDGHRLRVFAPEAA